MARSDGGWAEQQQRYQRQFEREAAQRAREQAAAEKVAVREAEQARVAARVAHSEHLTQQLNARVDELKTILLTGLGRSPTVDLRQYRRTARVSHLDLGHQARPAPEPDWARFAPQPPGAFRRAFGATAGYEYRLAEAEQAFATAQAQHAEAETHRHAFVRDAHRRHAAAVAAQEVEADRANKRLDAWIAGVAARSREDVEQYLAEVLKALPLPGGLPRRHDITFDRDDEHAVIQFELPAPEVVPEVSRVTYVKTRDELVPKDRPKQEREELYKALVSQLALLVIRELFCGDPALREVSLNGHVSATNPATGQSEYPCLISVVVERAKFDQLVLDRVSADECLRHLRARVSSHPYAVDAVQPLADFDRSRLSFIEGLRIVSGLDERPDLMAMTPSDFEHLIRELFEADPAVESVESLVTRQSNDGGVDGVIYVKQPLGRSMTVVQVKQYARRRTLGPHHVRELIGAMHEVKAGNGLLVTTSRFTSTAEKNATDFGRIQLINGNHLVHLLKQHLGKDVLIGDRVAPTRGDPAP